MAYQWKTQFTHHFIIFVYLVIAKLSFENVAM